MIVVLLGSRGITEVHFLSSLIHLFRCRFGVNTCTIVHGMLWHVYICVCCGLGYCLVLRTSYGTLYILEYILSKLSYSFNILSKCICSSSWSWILELCSFKSLLVPEMILVIVKDCILNIGVRME